MLKAKGASGSDLRLSNHNQLWVGMTKRSDITPEIVAQSLEYNPDTGVFIWKTRPRHHFDSNRAMNIWNGRFPNTEAGSIKHGRRIIRLFGVDIGANMLAYAIMTGEWSPVDVDHHNTDKADDTWSNLRSATRRQNQYNVGLRSSNTSGYKGVSYSKHNGKYVALIRANGKRHYLGYFDTAEEAHEAYCKAAAELHGEFARTG
jgi:hypothetical protein